MSIENILDFLSLSKIHSFYPFSFPSGSSAGSVLSIPGGTVERGGVNKVYLKIVTRENHPMKALNKAEEIKKHLQENLEGAFFDGSNKTVLNIEADTPQPLWIGEEGGLYSVSYNYTILEG